jgi:hypothetical protein
LSLVAADFDNDGDADVVVGADEGCELLRNDDPTAPPTFSVRTAESRLGDVRGGGALVVADYDHDGDLDLFASSASPLRTAVLRNNGTPTATDPTTFTDVTEEAGLAGEAVASPVLRDFDNDSRIDFVALGTAGDIRFFRNRGQRRFGVVESEATAAGVAPGTPMKGFTSLVAGDLTGDGWEDLVAVGPEQASLLANQGSLRFEVRPLSEGPATAAGVAGQRSIEPILFDPDADGDLDLVLTGREGVVFLENDGHGSFAVATDRVGLLNQGASILRAGDFDNDGDFDLVGCDGPRFPTVWRNQTPAGPPPLRVSLEGGKSNRSGMGAVVDVQDGEFYVRRTVTDVPLVVGLGGRTHLDYVRVSWPSLIVQNEVDVDVTERSSVHIKEKPEAMGSCPALYVRNADRHPFITDVLGTASLGLVLAGDTPMAFDDEELIKIPEALLPKESVPGTGSLELVLTEELNEIVYLDRVRLVAIDHPPDVSVYSNTILRDPPFPPADVVFVRNERPPLSIVDDHGADHRSEVAETDGRYAAAFTPFEGAFHGMATHHTLTMDLGDPLDPSTLVLVINAWMDWPETATFLAVGQNESIDLVLPMLEVKTPGGWRVVHAGFGIQALKPKDVVVDLRGRLEPGEHILRLSSNMACYWNRISIAEWVDAEHVAFERHELEPVRAALEFHGWASVYHPDDSPLVLYDYDRVNLKAPWVGSTGRFTRYGDVLALVSSWDDQYAILNTGDEVRVVFEVAGLPATALAGGDGSRPVLESPRVRDVFVHLAGFEKQADYGTLASGTVEPMPFRAMPTYPYVDRYPSTPLLDAYRRTFNTRVVGPSPAG